ncbi:MAG: cysteine desulfurase [Ruminococcaceae bacterium]|nr:cysteine desulfurase [Oscillospiraceae bacterium]
MFVYFDNSATTKTLKKVNEEMLLMLEEDFGNPSSLHSMGLRAEKKLEFSRKTIAEAIGATPDEIYFTSGGTESSNLCITGYLTRNKHAGKKIITSSVEHPSVMSQFDYLKEKGFDVKVIPCTMEKGFDYDAFEKEVDSSVSLVSIMHVNNETGYIFDIKRIKKILKKKGSGALLHCDCVQSFMKIPFTVKELGADLISLSSHKINGPKGVGAAYIKKGTLLSPLSLGGGQEKGLRNGTENTVGIYGFGVAAAEHLKTLNEDIGKMKKVKEYLYEGFSKMDKTVVNTDMANSAPHILNVSFLGIRSEILLHTFEKKDIYVSSGSACSSNHSGKKKILEIMGCDRSVFDSAIRFSFDSFSSLEEAEYAFSVIKEEVEILRKRLRV